ncbi:retrotransposon protein, putative, ty1-copia subclass, partial [Tanacetum coccineum]
LTTLPISFWGYALDSTARILNMVPTKKVNKTSYKIWHGKVPDLSYLKVWGFEALVKRDTPNKLESRSIKCIFIGYPKETMGDHGEPPNYRAALSDPESEKWLEAMNAEMQSMKDNQVWNLVDLPPNYKTIGSKWFFKKKTDMDGNIHTYGVDYEETFSPVADIKAIRILIAIAA